MEGKKENLILDKSFAFAVRVVNCCKFIQTNHQEYILTKQVLRSGTAIGALAREAMHGESKKDFIHKMSIALKEANETEYWIELLHKTEYLEERTYASIVSDLKDVKNILIAIVKTTKNSLT
jgi:four helix bundle protein